MTIYIEIVFISNLLIDGFIFSLVLTVLKLPLNPVKIFLLSVAGATLSSFYPYSGNYGMWIQIISMLIFPFFIRIPRHFNEYIVTLATFLSVTLILGGIVFAFNYFKSDLDYSTFTYGAFAITMSVAGMTLLILFKVLLKELKSHRIYNGNILRATVGNSRGKVDCKAFYDSGNRVFAKNGEPVIFIKEQVYNTLMPAEVDTINVVTPNGYGEMQVTDAELEIYFENGENRIYKVKAGKSPYLNGEAQIILHGDMTGE